MLEIGPKVKATNIADLKAALEACEDKWYNTDFANAENSMEPIIYTGSTKGEWLPCR